MLKQKKQKKKVNKPMKLSVTQKYLCDCTFNQTRTK